MAICLDYETFYSSKLKYGLKQMIAETYVRHELFDPYLLAVCDGKTSWAGHPKDFNWNALEGQTLLSHNRYFDNTVFNEQVRRGWIPNVKYKEWHCTANMTAYLCNRRALDNAVEFLYGIKLDKSARGEADGKHWPQDFSEEERAKMLKYAPADALWCWKLWNDHSAKWPEMERRLSTQTINQGMRGVQINTDLLNDYIVQTHEVKIKTEKMLPWLQDDGEIGDDWDDFKVSPTSTKCIAEQCRRVGIPCPPVKAHEGQEAYDDWETLYSKNHQWIQCLTAWRSVNKLYKTFLLVKARLRDDGTMPFGLKYFGAHTGRWAGAEKINFQNPRKKPILINEHGLMEADENRIDAAIYQKQDTGKYPEWVKYSLDFRALIIPRPGKIMISCDLAQIEPRVLAWLTNDKALMDMIRGGMSVYEAFARSNLGYDKPGKMDKRTDYYKMVKIMKLGLGYQAGWEKFITIAAKDGVDITKDDPEWMEVPDEFSSGMKKVSGYGKRSKEIVAEFRAKSPLTVGLWKKLDDLFKRSIGGTFTMTLPSGRNMSYRNVKCALRIKADAQGKMIKKYVFTAESDGRQKDYYGGKLCENLVQAAARDIFGMHLVNIEDAGHSVLFSSHDEAVCECDPATTPAEIEAIMSQSPPWMAGIPVAAEAKAMLHYEK